MAVGDITCLLPIQLLNTKITVPFMLLLLNKMLCGFVYVGFIIKWEPIFWFICIHLYSILRLQQKLIRAQ